MGLPTHSQKLACEYHSTKLMGPYKRPKLLPPRPSTGRGGSGGCGSTTSASASPIDLAHHDVERPEDHHRVGQLVPHRDLRQTRQVDEARWPHVVAIRVRRPVRDQVEADLALRPFDP